MPTIQEKEVKKVLLTIRPGVYSSQFTKSLISYVSCEKPYEVEYYVSSQGEYEQDTIKLFSEKMPEGSLMVFISPTTGFAPETIHRLVELTSNEKIYAVAVPIGASNFNGTKLVQTMDHARIMLATFSLSAKSSAVELDKDASVLVSDFQRDDMICIPHNIAKEGVDISRGYKALCQRTDCRLLTQFQVSCNGVMGCLLEQLRHIVYMRGMVV